MTTLSGPVHSAVIVGKGVIYLKNGKPRTGFLSKVKFDDQSNSVIAKIKKPGTCANPLGKHEYIPFESIIQETTANIESATNKFHFKYNGIDFYQMNHEDFSIGDEVVWMQPNREERPLVGKIVMIGHDGSQSAIVQFDEPTGKLPNYVPATNLSTHWNVVKMDEVLKLNEWIALNASQQSIEDSVVSPSAPILNEDPVDAQESGWRLI